MTVGSTVSLLKKGGRKTKATMSQKVTQRVTINIGDKSKRLPPKQPNYRVVRQTIPMYHSVFTPHQPERISPPQFRLIQQPNVLNPENYGKEPAVLKDAGDNALRTGSYTDPHHKTIPLESTDRQQPWVVPTNPSDIAQYKGSSRLQNTLNYNDPMNSRIISGDIPAVASQYVGGNNGLLQEGQTTKAIQPINPTVSFRKEKTYYPSQGQMPLDADEVDYEQFRPKFVMPKSAEEYATELRGKGKQAFVHSEAGAEEVHMMTGKGRKVIIEPSEETGSFKHGGRYNVF